MVRVSIASDVILLLFPKLRPTTIAGMTHISNVPLLLQHCSYLVTWVAKQLCHPLVTHNYLPEPGLTTTRLLLDVALRIYISHPHNGPLTSCSRNSQPPFLGLLTTFCALPFRIKHEPGLYHGCKQGRLPLQKQQ